MSETHERLRAELVVGIDSAMKVTYTIRGADELLVGLLGAVRLSETWIENRIKANTETREIVPGGKPLCATPGANSLETEVSKEVAIAAYWHAAQKIGARIQAIANSDERATYDVPLLLLKEL